MAIGLFTVLKSVPWAAVISNAPAVADGAKRLWKSVARQAPSPADQQALAPSEEQNVASLVAQLNALKHASSQLEEQMLASSELIKSLAEQQAQLVQLAEANRVRTLWLVRATSVLGIAALIALGLFVFQRYAV